MNIRVDLNYPINDGTEVVFRSPVDCSQVTGLVVYYIENGNTTSREFAFADAHGNNVGDVDHLFAENVVVKVILDVAMGMAYVQNADTNAYLESRFANIEDRLGSGEAVLYTEQTLTEEQQDQARTNIGAATLVDSKIGVDAWSSKNTVDRLCPSFEESGAAVVCEPVEGYPLNIVSHIQAAQAGTGDPSPDNIRPIIGYNAVNVWRGGKNLIDDVAFYQSKGFELQADGYWKFNATNGTLYENTAGLQGQFTVSLYGYFENASYNGVVIYILYADGTTEYYSKRDSNNFLSYTTNASKTVSKISLTRNSGTTEYYSYIKDLQIEFGTTATAYEPYRGETFTIDLGQTVYGGYVDLAKNKCVLTHAYYEITGQEKQHTYLNFWYVAGLTLPRPKDHKSGICSHYGYAQYGIDKIGVINDGTSLSGDLSAMYTSIEEWFAYLQAQYANGTPVTVVYELAEPIEYDIEVNNNIFTWGGPGTNELEQEQGVIYKVSDEVFTPDRIPELYNTVATYQPAPSWEPDYGEVIPPTEEHTFTAEEVVHVEPGTTDMWGDISGGYIYLGWKESEIYFVYDNSYSIGPFGDLSKGIWVFTSSGAYFANLRYQSSSDSEEVTPQEILGLAGTNTIYSNTGNTDVSGKADPNATIQDLYNKLNALSATMTALTGV